MRVGEASTLDLGAHTMLVTGNVDAPGTITNGIIQLSGATARLGGNLPTLEISGGASLQRATATSGSVSVTDGVDSLNYGAGAQYFFNHGPNGVRADYTRYDFRGAGNGSGDVFSISYVRKFGGQ